MKVISSFFVLISAVAIMHVVNAQTYMTDAEMLSTFPGATFGGISSSDGKTPWKQTYGMPKKGKSKGKGTGVWNNTETYKFSWKIKKGKWCEYWPSGSSCWNAERVDDTTIQMYKKGKKMSQVWKILDPA
ncbi:MAG: hypothetical protein AB8B87_27470 [Granulosicoccus sp.]